MTDGRTKGRSLGPRLVVAAAVLVLVAATAETVGLVLESRAGDDPAALGAAERWLPFDADARLRRTLALGSSEDRASRAALGAASEGLRRRPRDPNLLVLVGQIRGALEEDDSASRAFRDAVRWSDYDKGPAIVGATDRLEKARALETRAVRLSEEADRLQTSGSSDAAKERRRDAEETHRRAVEAARAATEIVDGLHPDAWGFADAQQVADEARRLLSEMGDRR